MITSLCYSLPNQGNVVDSVERLALMDMYVDLGSDRTPTSLHNPWAGGYYPVEDGFRRRQPA
jgi:urocanate hydratase